MPDQLNKQALINLLIDSPLREPIKINLIDIVNNTSDPDLPKIYTTITKELEIFQKATERRMKLAEETIAKLGGTSPAAAPAPETPASAPAPTTPNPLPPLDLPPLPTPPSAPLSVPPLDLPPLPTPPASSEAQTPPLASGAGNPPPLQPLGTPPTPTGSDLSTKAPAAADEAALAEIQKELDSLKSSAENDAAPPAPVPAPAT